MSRGKKCGQPIHTADTDTPPNALAEFSRNRRRLACPTRFKIPDSFGEGGVDLLIAKAARKSRRKRVPAEPGPLFGVLDGLTELLEQLVAVIARQQVTCGDDHRDRPVDELQCS